MKKITAASGWLIFILSLVLLSCSKPDQNNVESKQETNSGVAPVKVFEVRQQRISEKMLYTGVIEAWEKINVTPEVGGKITKINVEEGDYVTEGMILAELDTRAIRLQLEQAEAGVAVAEANYKDAQRNMERMERLIKESAVSDQQYEKVKLAFEASEAQLQQAKAALNLARYNLDVSIMEAPFSGIIASKNAEVGDVINPMMGGMGTASGVVTLVDYHKVKIEIELTQQDIIRIKKGLRAVVTVNALPGMEFIGRVAVVNQTADPLSKKFKVEIHIDNPELTLRPNTFGKVSLEMSTHEDAIVVPQKAILEHKYVIVAGKDDGLAHKREVVLGLENTDMIEIIKGLSVGEMVVVEGNFGLEDGTKIEIKEVIQ
ncbi:MAG: efflux RND transporter periplasmic adaptor subunit [Candidatus Aminicenantes bacterium]|nr:efflux RND transporter periplasmic adaptor subunit [Candidatus Aminicenantes bacterium]